MLIQWRVLYGPGEDQTLNFIVSCPYIAKTVTPRKSSRTSVAIARTQNRQTIAEKNYTRRWRFFIRNTLRMRMIKIVCKCFLSAGMFCNKMHHLYLFFMLGKKLLSCFLQHAKMPFFSKKSIIHSSPTNVKLLHHVASLHSGKTIDKTLERQYSSKNFIEHPYNIEGFPDENLFFFWKIWFFLERHSSIRINQNNQRKLKN